MRPLPDDIKNWWAKTIVSPEFRDGIQWLRENGRPSGSTVTPHEANILLGRMIAFEETIQKLLRLGELASDAGVSFVPSASASAPATGPRPTAGGTQIFDLPTDNGEPIIYETRNLGLEDS